MPFWIWLILGFVLLSFLGMFAATWPIAKKVYHNILVRTGPEKWTRANSYPPNPEHTRMFDLGMDWARENEAHKRPVFIENEGLKLAASISTSATSAAPSSSPAAPSRCTTATISHSPTPRRAATFSSSTAVPTA